MSHILLVEIVGVSDCDEAIQMLAAHTQLVGDYECLDLSEGRDPVKDFTYEYEKVPAGGSRKEL